MPDMKEKTAGKELKKLSRIDLLEIMVEQETEIDRLKLELAEARRQLEARELQLQEAGSIASAALRLNGVFEAAEKAAAEYLENIKKLEDKQQRLYKEKEAECNSRIEEMLIQTARFCEMKKEQASHEEESVENTDNGWDPFGSGSIRIDFA